MYGDTTDAFWRRWNNYNNNDRRFQRNESSMQQDLSEHILSESHNRFVRIVSVSLIDKSDSLQPKKK